jgi:hypothetical protein
MMFSPSRQQARQFLLSAWAKYRAGQALEGLEQVAAHIIALHPEHHALLEDAERHVDRDFLPEAGVENPFLHLSLHVAIAEQLQIDQPAGIKAEFARLQASRGSEHEALHAVLECLGETVWQAQRLGGGPDAGVYLECLRRQK